MEFGEGFVGGFRKLPVFHFEDSNGRVFVPDQTRAKRHALKQRRSGPSDEDQGEGPLPACRISVELGDQPQPALW